MLPRPDIIRRPPAESGVCKMSSSNSKKFVPIFKKKKVTGYGVFGFVFSVALFVLSCLLNWVWYWAGACFFVTPVAMVVNMWFSMPQPLDTRREKTQKQINFLLASVGCFVTFFLNIFMHSDGTLMTPSEFIETGVANVVFVIALIVVYIIIFAYLASMRGVAKDKAKKAIYAMTKGAVEMEGPDGKKYPIPNDYEIAWDMMFASSAYDNAHDVKASIPEGLLVQHVADCMYQEFKNNKWEMFRPQPFEVAKWSNLKSGKYWFDKDYQKQWIKYAYSVHIYAFAFWVKNGKYGSAKTDIDRIIEVLIKRGLGKNFDFVFIEAMKFRTDFYENVPEDIRDPQIDSVCERVLEREIEDKEFYTKQRLDELRGRLAQEQELREEQQEQELDKEKERKKLREEYEQKLKNLDNRERTLNALLDNTAYTNEENYLAGNLGETEYARRKFLRDEAEDKLRKDYENSIDKLNR